jgi:hypothetical protein
MLHAPPPFAFLTVSFNIAGNNMESLIPSDYSRWSSLGRFSNLNSGCCPCIQCLFVYVSHDPFFLPSLFAELMRLEGNALTGCMPDSICQLRANLAVDCSEVECSCCITCCNDIDDCAVNGKFYMFAVRECNTSE